MIKITNGATIIEVTRGAYDSIYKLQGFRPFKVKEEKVETKPAIEKKHDEFEELLEKPIGQWTKKEVKDFATAKGIDLTDTKNVNEAKELIKEFLSE